MRKINILAFAVTLATILLLLDFVDRYHEFYYQKTVQRFREDKAKYLFDTFIPKVIGEANQFSLSTINEVVSMLDNTYKDKEVLDKELGQLLDPIYMTKEVPDVVINMSKVIGDKALNNITDTRKKDDNDRIVWLNNVIIIDKSFKCKTQEAVRTLNVERNGDGVSKGQFSKKLFDRAVFDIHELGNNVTLWSCNPVGKDKVYYQDILNLDDTSLDNLRRLYLKYETDNELLRTIEILVSNKIRSNNTDYFGRDTLGPNGRVLKDNKLITITAGFNILDQLDVHRKDLEELNRYDNLVIQENERYHIMDLIISLFEWVAALSVISLYCVVSGWSKKK